VVSTLFVRLIFCYSIGLRLQFSALLASTRPAASIHSAAA